MTKFKLLCAGTLVATMTWARAHAAQISVSVDQPGHRISPTLWGIFFEDINNSADGGIYPELVRNRSFEDSEKLENWKFVTEANHKGSATIDDSGPLNPFNRRSLRVRAEGASRWITKVTGA